MHVCMKSRRLLQMLFMTHLHIFFLETGSLAGLEITKQTRQAGQRETGHYLLPCP